ncbi:thrH [Symbiodinium sp. CCMP2592]|nr:thrH [Symbiodinium sp. CCMP2592]
MVALVKLQKDLGLKPSPLEHLRRPPRRRTNLFRLRVRTAENVSMVFCNFFEADDEGFMKRLITRLKDQKLKTVQELQRLNFRIIAVGSSFNDIEMLHAAEKGILYRPSESIRKEITDIPIVKTYDELKAVIEGIVTEKAVPNGKRQKTA